MKKKNNSIQKKKQENREFEKLLHEEMKKNITHK